MAMGRKELELAEDRQLNLSDRSGSRGRRREPRSGSDTTKDGGPQESRSGSDTVKDNGGSFESRSGSDMTKDGGGSG